VKKFGKLRPEQISKSLQVFAELKADRFFWKASGYTDAELECPAAPSNVSGAGQTAGRAAGRGPDLQQHRGVGSRHRTS
jgi:hypothetical protein